MEDNHNEYTLLFNGVTDTIKTLEKMIKRLKALQQQAEELVICREEDEAAADPACTGGAVRVEENRFTAGHET